MADDASQDEPQDDAPTEIDTRNWAEDPDTRQRSTSFLQETLPHCRSDRSAFDADAKELYNVWDAKRDRHYYNGRAAIYIPSGHKAIERAAAKQLARLFPSGEDCFDISTLPPGEEEQEEIAQHLDSAKALMSYDLHQCMKIMSWIMPWLRQLNILGTSPIGLDYVTQEEVRSYTSRKRFRLARKTDQVAGGTSVPYLGANAVPHIDEVGPTGRPVDLFTWYVWPPTVSSLKDPGVLVFEDQLVSGETLEKWRDAGRYTFTDEEIKGHAGQSPKNSIWSSSIRMQENRGISTIDPKRNLYVVTTAYSTWSLQGNDAVPLPCQFTIVNDALVIQARQNQKWHQLPPYVVATLFRYIDEFYGRGLIHFTRSLGYMINDVANQSLDALTYILNPIVAVDPDFPDPDLLQFRPGAKWPIDKNKIFPIQIPDRSAEGFSILRQLYEFSQDVAGASTGGMALPTLGIAEGAKTATGQSLLVAAGDIDVNAIVTSIEKDTIEPMLSMIDSDEQQFLPQQGSRLLRALGPQAMPLLRDGMRVSRDMMLGTRIYHWTGNAVSEQREKFIKHGPDMLKILAELKGQNDPDYTIHLAPFVEDLYKSFGFPNGEKIIQIAEPGEGFDPDLEHAVMAAGWPLDPRKGENYIAHLQAHDKMVPVAMAAGWGDKLRKHMFKTLALLQLEGAKAIGPGLPGPQALPGQAPMPGAVPPGVLPGGNGGPVPPGAAPGQPSVDPRRAALLALLQARQGGWT